MRLVGKRSSRTVAAALVLFSASVAHSDEVTHWNAILERTVASTPHFLQSRSAAIAQLAVFEAVNAIVGDYEPYLGTIAASPWASPEAATVAAAHRALVTLHPEHAATLDVERAESLAAIPDGPGKDAGIAVGESAADAMLALRANDGANAMVPYTPLIGPGYWRPSPPEFRPAAFVGWGQVTRFAIDNGARFRLNPPPQIHTGKYAQDYNEVKALGGVISTMRPADRADVARFYAAVLPMPLWPAAARQVSAAQAKTLSENARDFAWLAMAVCDSLIASMEMKYHYSYWRPVTAIRDGAMDGNRDTDPDATWLSFVTTPAYPSYPGNHASAAGAARAVLEHVYGRDGHSITLISQAVPDVVLHYSSWNQITDDIDDARIYGGVHFRFDQEAGARLGRHVGTQVLQNTLRPAPGR
jgi:PAP2 superfamily